MEGEQKDRTKRNLWLAVLLFLANLLLPRYIEMITDDTMRNMALLMPPLSVAAGFLYFFKKYVDARFPKGQPVMDGAAISDLKMRYKEITQEDQDKDAERFSGINSIIGEDGLWIIQILGARSIALSCEEFFDTFKHFIKPKRKLQEILGFYEQCGIIDESERWIRLTPKGYEYYAWLKKNTKDS